MIPWCPLGHAEYLRKKKRLSIRLPPGFGVFAREWDKNKKLKYSKIKAFNRALAWAETAIALAKEGINHELI